MIKLSDLQDVIAEQQAAFGRAGSYECRMLQQISEPQRDFALIISGIRRCGKSTLLSQLIKRVGFERSLALNFDNMRLFGFEAEHFALLDEILRNNPQIDTIFFDEIQVVKGWEVYVREKLDNGYKIVVTGSNSSMLSRELGSKLTGRHLSNELFPFSFAEYCGFRGLEFGKAALLNYLNDGGFPLYLKTVGPNVLSTLVEDILYRDIAVRYNLRDMLTLKRLLMLLIGNVGNLVTASKLKQILGVGSTTTVTNYLSYFEQSYLIALVPKFSYSQKSQMANPRKLYCIDNGIVSCCSPSSSRDDGRRLENLVSNELSLISKEIFYYNESGSECDFITCDAHGNVTAVQVSYQLTADNRLREVAGLVDAMRFFDLDCGFLLTLDQRDLIIDGGKRIEIVPVYEYFGR